MAQSSTEAAGSNTAESKPEEKRPSGSHHVGSCALRDGVRHPGDQPAGASWGLPLEDTGWQSKVQARMSEAKDLGHT